MQCSFDLKSFRIILGPRRSKIVLSVARLDGYDRISNGELVASLTVAFRYVSNTRTVSVDKFFFSPLNRGVPAHSYVRAQFCFTLLQNQQNKFTVFSHRCVSTGRDVFPERGKNLIGNWRGILLRYENGINLFIRKQVNLLHFLLLVV